jgi:hypothetical protein
VRVSPALSADSAGQRFPPRSFGWVPTWAATLARLPESS